MRAPVHPDQPGRIDLSEQMLWAYFPDGTLRERHDRDGNRVFYEYDQNNNMVRAVDATGVADERDGPMEIKAVYDWVDRVTRVEDKKSIEGTYRTTTYRYDPNGNVEERTDGSRVNTFTYDQADWLESHVNKGDQPGCADDRRVENVWAATGWELLRTIKRGNGSCTWDTKQTTAWDWFPNGLLRTLSTKNHLNEVLESHEVSYLDDNGIYLNGHRTRDVFTLDGPNPGGAPDPCFPAACTAAWRYDPRDRLVFHDNGKQTLTDYDLDPVGNIETETITENDIVTGTRTFSYQGTRLQSLTEDGQTAKYFYDPTGALDCVTTGSGSAADCSPPTVPRRPPTCSRTTATIPWTGWSAPANTPAASGPTGPGTCTTPWTGWPWKRSPTGGRPPGPRRSPIWACQAWPPRRPKPTTSRAPRHTHTTPSDTGWP
ncbi:MAG: hypothetical protein ACRDIZ_08185 [Actinomycetota bacterium]